MGLHYVDEGQGPLVLLLHGFRYLWYAWRHQVRALAAAGYRVVAPDLRGFGQSDSPADVQSYEILRVGGDLVGLIPTLKETSAKETSAIVIGHDLGSRVAHSVAELRPELFRALVMPNTPVGPRDARRPSEQWKQIQTATGKHFYHYYFQEPGVADALMNANIRRTRRSIFYLVSGSAVGHERWRAFVGDGETVLDTVFDSERLPEWLPARALDYYVSEDERHGFTPPLSYYRCLGRNWEQTPFLDGLRLHQPSLFIGGAGDPARETFTRPTTGLRATCRTCGRRSCWRASGTVRPKKSRKRSTACSWNPCQGQRQGRSYRHAPEGRLMTLVGLKSVPAGAASGGQVKKSQTVV